VATQIGIWRGRGPGETFPTLGHPPRCILMGGEHPEKHSKIVGLTPSNHHFSGSEAVGHWPKAMG